MGTYAYHNPQKKNLLQTIELYTCALHLYVCCSFQICVTIFVGNALLTKC